MRVVHKCQTCGHLDTAGWSSSDMPEGAYRGASNYQWPRPRCGQGCKACARECAWGSSRLSPTYTWPHELEEKLYPPGESWSGIILCRCEPCRDLYAETTGGAS